MSDSRLALDATAASASDGAETKESHETGTNGHGGSGHFTKEDETNESVASDAEMSENGTKSGEISGSVATDTETDASLVKSSESSENVAKGSEINDSKPTGGSETGVAKIPGSQEDKTAQPITDQPSNGDRQPDESANQDGSSTSSDDTASACSSHSEGHHPVVFMYSPPKRVYGGGGGGGGGSGGGKQKAVPGGPAARLSRPTIPGAASGGGGNKTAEAVAPANKGHHQEKQRQEPQPPRKAPGAPRDDGRESRPNTSGTPGGARQSATRRNPSASPSRSPDAAKRPTTGGQAGGSQASGSSRRRQRHQRGETACDDKSSINEFKDKLLEAKAGLKGLLKEIATVRHETLRARSARGHRLSTLSAKYAANSYCDTRVIDFYINKDTSREFYPAAKQTATTLVDPWEDLARQAPVDRVRRPESRKQPRHHHQSQHPQSPGSATSRAHHQQPAESVGTNFRATAEYWRRPVWFGELPKIRASIREARADTGTRRRQRDYARAAEECRSIDLEGIDRLPGRRSRRSLARSCSVYMSGTPGSRAALDDCLERVRTRTGRRWDSPSDHGGGNDRHQRHDVGGGSLMSGRRQHQQGGRAASSSRGSHRTTGGQSADEPPVVVAG